MNFFLYQHEYFMNSIFNFLYRHVYLLFFMLITFIGTFYYFLSCYLPLLCKNNGQNASLSARKLPV